MTEETIVIFTVAAIVFAIGGLSMLLVSLVDWLKNKLGDSED